MGFVKLHGFDGELRTVVGEANKTLEQTILKSEHPGLKDRQHKASCEKRG